MSAEVSIRGALLGHRYRIEGPLGRGGMGRVFAAEDEELGRKVAIKLLPQERWNDPAAVERFMRQARAMACVDHPGIVRVYDRGLHDDRIPYVVMQLLVGRDLRQAVREGGAFHPGAAVEIGIELCSALEAVHGQGVIHRDLKPSNIFLCEEGGSQRAKLLDFGIARIMNESTLTRTSDVLGTLAYMAPELLTSSKEAGVASDLYAVACIVYEMVCGQPPFRALSRAELAAAIKSDAPAPLEGRVKALPAGLQALLLRNLDKDPQARHGSARELLEALRALPRAAAPAAERRGRPNLDRSELAGGRYRLIAQLGEGSFGTVYEAIDERSKTRIALKRLRLPRSHDLSRFKREFRIAADLEHPNLVRLHELWVEREQVFMTMELLAGEDLYAHVRAAPERLVPSFAQLASALAALHGHGLVHRDLKPANVIVERDGRVVLLDFGLTVADGAASVVAGTPSYMPKEALAGEIGPAIDLFALGVMLHEALTGRRPLGTDDEFEPATPVEAELWSLCQRLLSETPSARPSAAAVREVLQRLSSGADTQRRASPKGAPAEGDAGSSTGPFVGREQEHALLRAALAQAAEGPRVVLLQGESGIGKSRLLAELARGLPANALCLTSRCRQGEIVPYPALDSAIDALADHLSRLPRRLLTTLLPRNSDALAQLFPVLQRICPELPGGHLPRDPVQVRTLAYDALRRLLRSLNEQTPLVIVIDDAQWIDPDSASLLTYLLAGHEPITGLLVVAERRAQEPNPELDAWIASLAVGVERVSLSGLRPRDSEALAQALSGEAGPLGADATRRIVDQSAGNPLLLSTLVAHAQTQGEAGELSLEAAFRARLERVGPCAQSLLELAALCERPLPLTLLWQAAGGENREAEVALRGARLARRINVHGREAIEPFHARVRETILATLDPEARTQRHRALCAALDGHAAEFPDALIEHLSGAGEGPRAAQLAASAAAAAREQLAFDRAAAMYEVALREGRPSREERLYWLEQLACALRNAGRSVDAASALTQAASVCEGAAANRLLREAGELLLYAGQREQGLQLLAPMLERTGLSLPAAGPEGIAEGLAAYEALAQRGLEPKPRAQPPSALELERLDLCLIVAHGLSMIDLRGIPFAMRALSLALDLDDPERLQRASAAFVTLNAGIFYNPLIAPALELCRELTAQIGTPYARALLHHAEGEAGHFSGRFLVGEAAFERAERLLLESCVGKNRELAAVRSGAVLIEYAQKGDFQSQLARTLSWQADAIARKDAFHENFLRLAHSIVWIAQDDPDKARAELTHAKQQWRDGAGAYELGLMEFWDIIDRYEGDDDAHLHPLQGRKDLLESPAASSTFLAGYIHLHRAWGSIRALAAGRHGGGERELAQQSIAALRAITLDIWQAVADAFEANFVYLNGEREVALARLDRSERTFRRLHMRCLAACARARHGELSGGAFGARLVHEASAELMQLGIARPDRWTRAYFSLFAPERIGELTLTNSTLGPAAG